MKPKLQDLVVPHPDLGPATIWPQSSSVASETQFPYVHIKTPSFFLGKDVLGWMTKHTESLAALFSFPPLWPHHFRVALENEAHPPAAQARVEVNKAHFE